MTSDEIIQIIHETKKAIMMLMLFWMIISGRFDGIVVAFWLMITT